jgi:signal transduction histidine kinase
MLSPRRLQGLFLAVTLLFAAAVGWLGWRLLEQDRALARQRRLEQLEAAADRVAGALYRRLAELEETLDHPGAGSLPPGTVLLRARGGSLEISPPNALLYHPFVPEARQTPPAVFAASDELEFRRDDPAAAAAALRPLAGSADLAVRAAALARLGRNLKKSGRQDEALRVYEQLAGMGAVEVDGLPAELAAAESRCALFEELKRRPELAREAVVLYRNLAQGRWRLRRAAYEFQLEQARQWLGATPPPAADEGKAALSAAAEAVWDSWRREPAGKGRRIVPGDRPVLAAWNSTPEELAALLAPAATLDAALGEAGAFPAALADSEGRPLLGRFEAAARARVQRAPASTRLPWTLEVASLDDGTGQLAGRSWILGGGFALLVALLAGVGFLVARVVSKEMALARLQADFVAAVSHEFRSPLSSITQIAELLNEERWPTPEHRRKGCDILTRESARLRRLVEGLLDFARIEAGTAGYHLEPVEPEEMVRAVVEDFRPAANGSGVELTVAADLPGIRADCEALRRALWNLLENAVKYSPAPARIRVEAAGEDGKLAIRVRDEGIGIPPAEQAQVFRKFFRGSEALARGVKGTGIGLAMVRHIVDGHGGEIKLESEPGRGSTFTILLPAEREA